MTYPTATTSALAAVLSGSANAALRGEPTTANAVLVTLAALQVAYENTGVAVVPGNIATALGLSQGTVKGHLRTLEKKGLATTDGYTWRVAA